MGKIVIIGAGPAEINFTVQSAAQIDSPKTGDRAGVFGFSILAFVSGITSFIQCFGMVKVLPFIFAFVGINGVVEAVVCFVVGTAISIALKKVH
mgnify:CR=1 FL=1